MVHLPRPEGATDADFKPTRRALAGLMMFAGYALGGGPARAETVHTDEAGLFTREATIPSNGFDLPAYVAMPADAKKRPVVIVVSEIFGVHEYIRDTARRLAKAGYVAIAPAFFARAGDPAPLTDQDEIRKIVATATNAQVMGDIKATIAWLGTNPDIGQPRKGFGKAKFADTKRIGVTGFCWGGAVVWMAAAQIPQIKAGVAWYGRLAKPKAGAFLGDENRAWPLDVVQELHAPVLGLYAGQDQGIPLSDVDAMRAALKAAGEKRDEIVVYPDAKHGFHADYRQSYDQAAAEDGWKRLLAWFGKYL
ncbi:dienelactone hydrolase family protein [Caulobacter sp. 17J80-11]|uniref:dienelactone hydrolase family protein n=1 Tax=Caulobacter sp. 17J80-11 TaxID=2763502 RepID=UPI0016534822|nr:dienelactone hydrolase family protein [Caulobacter sp. 17J80-11]MBC6982834.1 dienelactone hydrolase family protein [Caulobacter sp. 17J80-11]